VTLMYRVLTHPAVEDGSVPFHLLRTEGDAVLWSEGRVFVRLAGDRGAVYEIEGEVPVTVPDACRMVRTWKERH